MFTKKANNWLISHIVKEHTGDGLLMEEWAYVINQETAEVKKVKVNE